MSVTDNKNATVPLFESRNTTHGVTDDEKSHAGIIRGVIKEVQAEAGHCEHGKPLLFGGCKECQAERVAKSRELFARAVDAQATAEMCGKCGRAMAASEAVVIRSLPVGRGRWYVPVCAECGRLGEHLKGDARPCYWCERPVFMSYEVFSARRRVGIFCCDRCRRTWHNRRNSAIRKRQRGRYLQKTCTVCDEPFTATRSDQKTCSPACRQKAYRDRNKMVG